MKVLFILPCFPVPAHSGAAIAALDTLRSLHTLCELHLLVPPPQNARAANETLLQQVLPGISVHFYPIREAQPARLEIYATAAQAAITDESYWERAWHNRDLRTAVQGLTAEHQFDVVHCDWLQPAVSLRGLNLPLVLRTLDVHFVGMLDWVESLPSGDKVRKGYWRRQVRRFRNSECATLSAARAVVTVSAEDEAILRDEGVSNIVTIPPPREVQPAAPRPSEPQARCKAVFIGRLDMPVNREAFFLFADKVWPEVSEKCRANVRIAFAGGCPDEEVRRRASELGFEIHAPLSDAEALRLFGEAEIFLSPVKSGTGIKMKTLEAMAHGKPILGFAGAFRGVPVEDNKHAFIADSSKDFAHLLERLVFDAALRSEVGVMAREFVRVKFDPAVLGAQLMDVYSRVNLSTRASALEWARPTR